MTDSQIEAAMTMTNAELERTHDPQRRQTLKVRLRFLRHAELVNATKNWDQDSN